MMKATSSKTDSEVDVVTLEGELDYHVSSDLRAELDKLVESQASRVVLNFEKVAYIDSSAIAAFVELSQRIKPAGGRIAFFNLNESVKKIFEVAKLNLFFSLADTEAEAISAVSS